MKKWMTLFAVLFALHFNYGQTEINSIKIRDISGFDAQADAKGKTPSSPSEVNVTTLLSEAFSTATFPPTGWTVDKQTTNWKSAAAKLAGGTSPEARFYYSPVFTDTSRFISPVINTTGNTVLLLKFKQYLSWYTSTFKIGVVTRSNNGPWTVAWSIDATAEIPAEEKTIILNNSDVGKATFQFAFFFQGYSDNLNYWDIDDVVLTTSNPHDVSIISIAGGNQFTSGTADTIKASILNLGSNTDTFTATAKVYDYAGTTLFTNTQTVTALGIGATGTVTFSPYTLPTSNALYKVEVTAVLTGDAAPENNTLSKYINTYTTQKNLVIVEVGTGTWCQYCPGAQLAGDDLVKNGKNVGVVEYHYSDAYQNRSSLYRNSYYGVSGYPTAFFDGTQSFVGGSNTTSVYSYWLPFYTAQYAVKTPLNVALSGGKISANNYSLNINIQKLAQFINPNTRLFVALTESNIPFTWQGQTEVNSAERLLLPDSLGYSFDISNQNVLNVPLTFKTDTSWVSSKLELVAWVQDYSTKEIFNGAKIKLSDLNGSTPVELTSFTGFASTDGVKLAWTTATETNNKGFEIQKSADGKTFSKIGYIEGNGSSTIIRSYSFTDASANKDLAYYRLKQIDLDGTINLSSVIEVNTKLPGSFELNQNYPNPFNPATKISYSVASAGLVTVKVFNVTGQEVATLVNEIKAPGAYNINFNASNLTSGIYFYKMTAKDFMQVKKMSVLK